jgi:uncharacterized protein YyaL (SSP411 family)
MREDPGTGRVIDEGIAWLGRAQDHSRSRDGGVARHFSLLYGWATSYPETTGYIVPTMLDYARRRGDLSVRDRARRMLDWLTSIQLPCGGFQGGMIDSQPVVPVTFNTGQILLGLARGVREFGDEYRVAMRRAADWLVRTQDADGCWRKFPTPFAVAGEKAYETHVAWGLLEAAQVEPGHSYTEAALANIGWALTLQRDNGWFDRCCLDDNSRPLTHTLGYVLRGILEAYRHAGEGAHLAAARRMADGLLTATRDDGLLPGRLDSKWQGSVRWVCLTGSLQIAHCWLMLYQFTGDAVYRDAARAANRFVRRTVRIDGPAETRGGVKGSWPIDGDYGAYQYLNWACKFFVDSNLLEQELEGRVEDHARTPL